MAVMSDPTAIWLLPPPPMIRVSAVGTTVRAEAMLVYPLRAGWRGADSCR